MHFTIKLYPIFREKIFHVKNKYRRRSRKRAYLRFLRDVLMIIARLSVRRALFLRIRKGSIIEKDNEIFRRNEPARTRSRSCIPSYHYPFHSFVLIAFYPPADIAYGRGIPLPRKSNEQIKRRPRLKLAVVRKIVVRDFVPLVCIYIYIYVTFGPTLIPLIFARAARFAAKTRRYARSETRPSTAVN